MMNPVTEWRKGCGGEWERSIRAVEAFIKERDAYTCEDVADDIWENDDKVAYHARIAEQEANRTRPYDEWKHDRWGT